jgi:hypothetical protein
MRVIDGFKFNDFCQQCQNVREHTIAVDNSTVIGMCDICKFQRPLTELRQEFYSKTSLWTTRFKIGNLSSVVEGKLVDAIRANTK